RRPAPIESQFLFAAPLNAPATDSPRSRRRSATPGRRRRTTDKAAGQTSGANPTRPDCRNLQQDADNLSVRDLLKGVRRSLVAEFVAQRDARPLIAEKRFPTERAPPPPSRRASDGPSIATTTRPRHTYARVSD